MEKGNCQNTRDHYVEHRTEGVRQQFLIHKRETWLLMRHSSMMSSMLPSGIHSLAIKSNNISSAVLSVFLSLITMILSRLELSNFSLWTTDEGS